MAQARDWLPERIRRSRFAARPSARHNRPGSTCSEVLVEECRDLSERLFGLGHTIVKLVLGVRLPLVNLELRLDPSPPKLAMHPHRIAEQQVARPASQD